MNQYTEAEVLSMHNVVAGGISTPDALTDAARREGILAVCLGCGSVHAVEGGTSEALRKASSDYYNSEAGGHFLDCCEDADTIVY